MRTSMVYGLLAVAVGSIACGSANSGVQTAYNAILNGFYVVPADSSVGQATVTMSVSGLTVSGTLNITAAASTGYTAAHIHVGNSGSNGAVVLNLCGGQTAAPGQTPATLPACAVGAIPFSYTATSTSQLLPGSAGAGACGTVAAPANCPTFGTFVANVESEGYYVQVHSTQHPAGEIRGQILRTAQTF